MTPALERRIEPGARAAAAKAGALAGLTVALVGLPQSLAYALMSGLPPAYGLSTGPTNTTGLLSSPPWRRSSGRTGRVIVDLSHTHPLRVVPAEAEPGLSVRRCLERMREEPPPSDASAYS